MCVIVDLPDGLKLAALILQLIGIIVGLGVVFEVVLSKTLLRSFFAALNIAQQISLQPNKKLIHEFTISENIDDLYSEISNFKIFFISVILSFASIILVLGFWGFLVYRLYQLFAFDIPISGKFWFPFSFWVIFFIVINYQLSAALLNIPTKIPKPTEWLLKFIWCWYKEIWDSIRIALLVILLIIFLIPMWFIKPVYKNFNMGNRIHRVNYYLIYAGTVFFCSVIIQITLIFIK